MASRGGFTLIELLIFSAILAGIIIVFTTVLVVATRVQVRQTAAAEVNQQSEFLLETIQRYVENSSLVDVPVDAPTSTLKLWLSSSAAVPTYIFLSSSTGPGIVYVGTSTTPDINNALTSNRLTVSKLAFTRRPHPGGHDSVSVSFTIQNNTQSVQQRFVQSLQTAITRVSAATFDSNLDSLSTGLRLGGSRTSWTAINQDVIQFSGQSVGINMAPTVSQQGLEVAGGLHLYTAGLGQPTCDATSRGTVWVVRGVGTASDTLQLCIQKGGGGYIWQPILFGPIGYGG